jgi:sugar/nucleoside kinase (ribokinase family)
VSVTVVSLGVHVLDVLVRPVEAIPEGQGGQLVEQIRATAAGTAGGTSLTLAKLGARTRSAGAIGSDPLGDLLVELLQRGGVETDLLLRRDEVQTSASVLPIRPNGERPAFHVVGANATYGADDAPREAIEQADHLHLGAPEFHGRRGGGDRARGRPRERHAHLRRRACRRRPRPVRLDRPRVAALDVFLPNDEQVLGFTVESELEAGCRALLDRGVGMVAATCGADGAIVAEGDRILRVPAFDIDVVDTTGCGDAFSAGFVVGLGLGRDPRDAAVLGCAAAALVAGGLGSDHGDFDLEAADAFAAATPVRS